LDGDCGSWNIGAGAFCYRYNLSVASFIELTVLRLYRFDKIAPANRRLAGQSDGPIKKWGRVETRPRFSSAQTEPVESGRPVGGR
jgi:hypothetical protein